LEKLSFRNGLERERTIDKDIDKAYRHSQVSLGALWCKLASVGGRLRQATQRGEARKDIYRITYPVNGRSGVGS
jgi:hypothetical protein